MKVVGLITEYNPFHNGHKYHIEEARRITGADYVIAVMSGNYVQRGAPAIINKYCRAEMALRNGVDLVLELPVCYATGSAEYFAHGAVSILNKLGVVDYLCFGSECGDLSLLQEAVDFLLHPPVDFDASIQAFLKLGQSYPAARQSALSQALQSADTNHSKEILSLLTEPNNILGIEYLKALHSFSSSIKPVTIQRISAHYHDKELSSKEKELYPGIISSATAIRHAIHGNASDEPDRLFDSVPANVFRILEANMQKTYPIADEDFSLLIKYKLLSEDNSLLSSYFDISCDLADRIKNMADYGYSLSDLAEKLKSKNMTMTRINRALFHILLNIKSEFMDEYKASGYTSYARILGSKKESTVLLRKIDNNGTIPVLTKVAKAKEQLSPLEMRMLSEDIFATHLYNHVVYEKYGTYIPNEYKHGLCII